MSVRHPQSAEQREDAARQVARLRAIYAVAAGALLLFALPVYQSAVLGPAGYLAAVTPAAQRGDFAPLLAWITRNATADRIQRILQLVPFLLALPLPGFLYGRLWLTPEAEHARPAEAHGAEAEDAQPEGAPVATEARERTLDERTLGVGMLWSGRVGLALFALAILLGLLTSATSASAYAGATTAPGRSAAVASFAASYVAQTLIAQVLGGLALALFLVLLTRRMSQVPLYFRLYGYLIAAVLALNALAFLFDPRQVQTPFTTGALFGLGLWLLGLGLFLPGIGREATPEAA
ncbi:MAG TPA: hypothetical protein VF120_08810 [Ktedonobacterales bacterium]